MKALLKRRKPIDNRDSLPGPDAVEVTGRYLKVGDGYTSTLAVTGYPAEVGAGWLEPVLGYPGRLDVALHIEPIPPAIAADRLRKQRARLESSRRADAGKGRLDNPEIDAAAADAAELAGRLARGEGRLFRLAVYLTIHAADPQELTERVTEVRTLASSLLLGTQPMTWRQVQAWVATLPVGVDPVKMHRTFDTLALSAAFPFTSPDVPAPTVNDVFYGFNTGGPGVVSWDRWSQENYNMIILGRSGAGKSFTGKLDLLRNLYRGLQACVIDPDDEYIKLADALGGVVIRLGQPEVKINPMALRPSEPYALRDRSDFLHGFIEVLLGSISAEEQTALDAAILAAYHAKGINFDARTWRRTPPLLADLAAELRAGGPAGELLAARMAPYVSGSFSYMFDGHSTHRPDVHLVVYAIRDLPEQLKAAGTLLVLDAIEQQINAVGRSTPLLVHIDEAWKLLSTGPGARFLLKLAKGARKQLVGLTLLTQDALDVLSSTGGLAIVSNCATQILLKQSPQAIAKVAEAFGLTEGERTYLLSAPLGHALLLGGPVRVGFTAVADDDERDLVSTVTAR